MIVGDTSWWDDLFECDLVPSVLALVVKTWEKMPKPAPSDKETAVSLRLFCALRNARERNAHQFTIHYEHVEVDTDLMKVTGRKDIVFYPPSNQEEIYLCLEAKRLNATISGKRVSLADGYVKDGMQRYVDGQYSRAVRHGAMLGYVLDGDIDRAIKNVEANIRSHVAELRMDEPGGFIASTVRPDDPRTKETHHRRLDEKAVFRIHHLFVSGISA